MKKIILLLAIITLAVYFNTLGHSFVWDDHFTIEENDFITDVKYIPKIFVTDLFHSYAEKSGAEHRNYYRPIQTLSFLIDYHIWKMNPFGFHLTNVLLHLANGILIFIAVFLICKSRLISLFTSILFLVHPVQTGAVAYLTGRSDVLACFFLLGSFIFYVIYRSATPLSVLTFIFALLSKEIALIFPLILIFYDITYNRDRELYSGRNNLSLILKRYSAYFAVAAVYIALRLTIFNFTPGKKIFLEWRVIYNNLLTMSRTLMEYIWFLIYPSNLHMERSVPLATSVFEGDIALSLVGLACLIFLTFVCYKRWRTTFFGIMWFVIFLLPVSNVISLNALISEHWLYIPSIGFFLLISILFSKLQFIKFKYNFILALFILLAFLYSYKTVERNKDWKDDLSIYYATLKDSPRKDKMYYNIGTTYHSQGSLEEAAKFYRLAIDRGMKRAEVYTNLAVVYMELGRFKESEENFKKALALNPNDAFAYNGRGALFEKRGLIKKAISEYKKALECHPDFYDAHVNLDRARSILKMQTPK
jgi:tetratricopeptide (TPR) repeat protein